MCSGSDVESGLRGPTHAQHYDLLSPEAAVAVAPAGAGGGAGAGGAAADGSGGATAPSRYGSGFIGLCESMANTITPAAAASAGE